MADKWYPLSLDLFTAAVDCDGRARTKKTPGRLLQAKRLDLRTSEVKTKRNVNDYTLANIVFNDDE